MSHITSPTYTNNNDFHTINGVTVTESDLNAPLNVIENVIDNENDCDIINSFMNSTNEEVGYYSLSY